MDPFEDTGATGAHSELAFPLKIPSYLLNTPPEHEVSKRSSISFGQQQEDLWSAEATLIIFIHGGNKQQTHCSFLSPGWSREK